MLEAERLAQNCKHIPDRREYLEYYAEWYAIRARAERTKAAACFY